MKHETRLKKGVDGWNKWRGDNPRIAPDLRGANLRGANLDFSCLPLQCKSFGMKVDDRIASQLFMHAANLDFGGCSDEMKADIESAWAYVKRVADRFVAYQDDVRHLPDLPVI